MNRPPPVPPKKTVALKRTSGNAMVMDHGCPPKPPPPPPPSTKPTFSQNSPQTPGKIDRTPVPGSRPPLPLRSVPARFNQSIKPPLPPVLPKRPITRNDSAHSSTAVSSKSNLRAPPPPPPPPPLYPCTKEI
ncbi:hypothetical protein MXB_3671 [Myxobolus squamalis]|nr:hypothetical protein MXB_3671 [Myxobolus squamalis]